MQSRSCLRLCFSFLLGVTLFVAAGRAEAYPWMNRHGYTGCATCHADPSGAGLLTPYGRAQSELLLSTRYTHAEAEDEPSRFSGQLFGIGPLPEELLVGGWLRSGYIWNSVDGHLVDHRYLLMRADLGAQVNVGKFRANGSLGIASSDSRPLSQQAALTNNAGAANLVSREHWVGLDLADDAVLVRAGRINLPFGLRNIEHTSWVRAETRTDFNQAQQHGAAIAYNSASFRTEGMLVLGNFQMRPDVYRERGIVGYAELALNDHTTAGISVLATRAAADVSNPKETFRQAHGAFARISFWTPLVFLVEADALITSASGSGTSVGYTGFLQADYEVLRGLHLALTGEGLRRPKAGSDIGAGGWATVSWFFLPHFDARVDVVRRSGLGAPDTMTYLAQLQGYL